MKVKDITSVIESFAPLSWQQPYDNSGLIVGRELDEVNGALIAVDLTEEVLDEAQAKGVNMVITHHPIVFHPLKRFNSADVVQRCVERAIKSDIVIYACHTNLDSAPKGMSWHLAQKLGVQNLTLLQPFEKCEDVGFGVVGSLEHPMATTDFLTHIQNALNVKVIRHSDIASKSVQRIALCTGSGASLMGEARNAGCDIYVTADLKYNDFMVPDMNFTVADIGHFESEYCAIEIIFDILSKNLPIFALCKSESARNPVNYHI